MKKEQLKKEIIKYFQDKYGDKIDTSQLPLEGGLMSYLGIDSLSSLEILIDMEDLLGIEIKDDMLTFNLVDNISHMVCTFEKLI